MKSTDLLNDINGICGRLCGGTASGALQQDASLLIRLLDEIVGDQSIEIKQLTARIKVLDKRLADRPTVNKFMKRKAAPKHRS